MMPHDEKRWSLGLLGEVLTKQAWNFALLFMLSVVITLFALIPTIYMLQIYDRLMLSMRLESLLLVSALVLFFYGFHLMTENLRAKLMIVISHHMEDGLNQRLFSQSTQAYLRDKGVNPAEQLRDFTEFKQYLTSAPLIAWFDFVLSPVFLLVAFLLHPLLGVSCLVIIVLQSGLLWLSHRSQHAYNTQVTIAQASPRQFLDANLRQLTPITVMGMAEAFLATLNRLYTARLQAEHQAREGAAPYQAISRSFRQSVQLLSLAIGAYLVIQGEISAGSMIAANLMFSKALAPFDQVIQLWPQSVRFWAANQRLTNLLQVATPASTTKQTIQALVSLSLTEVSVSFPGALSPALAHIHLSLQAGDVVAVVGKSGSGKSTLGKVLMGILPTQTGDMRINDLPFQAIDADSFHTRVGYLPQDFQLFEGTVAENIARFAPLASADVIAAARQAGIHDWVLRLPNGYQTRLGAEGMGLSGGQKQQVGIARAIYGNMQLIVLDEPNANMDAQGEKALNQWLQAQTQVDAITVVISHRESVLNAVNKMIWLEQGKIKAAGEKHAVLAAMQTENTHG